MKHIINSRSMYEYYKAYPAQYLNIVLNYLKREPSTINILKLKFGNNFAGNNVQTSFLSYGNEMRLDNILTRIDDMLEFIAHLVGQNKTLKEINNIFEQKNELDLLKYIHNILKENKKEKVLSLNQFMADNNVDFKILKEIVDFHGEANERIAFKYKYGLGVKKYSDTEIMNFLNITNSTLIIYLNNVLKNLPNLLKQYQNSKENLKVKEIKPKAKATLKPLPDEKLEKIKDTKTENSNRKTPKKLINYIFEEEKTKEEIAHYQTKLNKIIEIYFNQSPVQFTVLKKLANNDLLSEIDLKNISKSECTSFYILVKKLKTYLELPDEKIDNSKRLIDYIFNERKTREEIAYYQEKLNKIIAIYANKAPVQYAILKKLTNNDLLSEINLKNISKVEQNHFYILVKRLKRYLELPDENIDNSKYLIDYLFKEEKTKEEIAYYQAKLNKIIEIYANKASAQFTVLKKLTNNDLLSKINLKNFSTSEQTSFYVLVKKLKTYLELPDEKLEKIKDTKTKSSNRKTPKKLINYIFEEEKTSEEIDYYQAKLNKIIEIYANEASIQFTVLKKVANNDLLSEINLKNISKSEYAAFYNVIRKLKTNLELPDEKLEKIKDAKTKTENSNKKLPKKLINYIFKEEKTSEEIAYYQAKLDKIIEIYSNQSPLQFTILKKLTNNDLLSEINLKSISKKEQKPFYVLVKKLKMYLELPDEKIDNSKCLIDYLFNERKTKEEIAHYQKKLNKIIEIYANRAPAQYAILKKLTNNDLLSKINLKNISKTDKKSFYILVKKLKTYLELPDEKIEEINIRKKEFSKRLIDYIFDDELTAEEIAYYQEKLPRFIEFNTINSPIGINVFTKITNNDLMSKIDLTNFSLKEKNYFYIIVKKIKEYFKNNLEDVKYLNYVDLAVYKFYYKGYRPDKICKILNVPLEDVMCSLINNLNNYDSLEIIGYISKKHPEYLRMVLDSTYLATFLNEVSDLEKNVIYLKLLGVYNENITDAVIAEILNLPLDEVINYEIMTKYDEINKLNSLFKSNKELSVKLDKKN